MSSIDKINVGGVDFDIKSSPTPVMAPVETGTTATQAYAVGDYVIVDSTLHEVTAAIAIGDTFTEGTNISTSTSLGDEIKQLNNDLSDKVSGFTETTYSAVTGLAYDSTKKKLGLKVGADTVIPFSSKPFEYAITLFAYDNSSGGGDYFYAVTDFTKSDVKLSTSGIHESWGTIPFSSNNYLTCVNQPSGIHSATFTVKKACWYRPNSGTAFTRLAANTTITRTSMYNSSMGLAFIFD